MANMAAASGVYHQMVVPDPYHYHEAQCHLVPTIISHTTTEIKKEPKKRKKVVDKNGSDKKKGRVTEQANSSSAPRPDSDSRPTPASFGKGNKAEACPVCNKRKCFRHLDARKGIQLSRKTPEDVVIILKKHMLKLLSNQDINSICKIDQKSNELCIDISKLHQSYLDEYEPQAVETPSQDNKDSKPRVKKWLYRKIFLDEFKTFEYSACKNQLAELRKYIDNYIQQKKKKVTKPKSSPQQQSQSQMIPQDYSLNNHSIANGTSADMVRTGLAPGVVTSSGHNPVTSTTAYQPNLMSIGVDSSSIPPVSMPVGGATPTLHNSLATYMTQQVPTNLLFGLGQQQQPPPAQQQPLNLQTSHQTSMQPQGHQPSAVHPPPGVPPGTPHAAAAPPLPLNLHNPYYVSFGPMLPLHMSPQHNHQQQFQPNLMQPQHNFNQHAMYQ